jgi:hypothetical protein
MLIKYITRLFKTLLNNERLNDRKRLKGYLKYPFRIKKSLHPNGERERELRPPSRVLRIDTSLGFYHL